MVDSGRQMVMPSTNISKLAQKFAKVLFLFLNWYFTSLGVFFLPHALTFKFPKEISTQFNF